MLAVLNRRDAFVSLPTGFGKSLIYQVLAMIVERPTIVISPLTALMTDQELALRKRGVPVVAIHSRLGKQCRIGGIDRGRVDDGAAGLHVRHGGLERWPRVPSSS